MFVKDWDNSKNLDKSLQKNRAGPVKERNLEDVPFHTSDTLSAITKVRCRGWHWLGEGAPLQSVKQPKVISVNFMSES